MTMSKLIITQESLNKALNYLISSKRIPDPIKEEFTKILCKLVETEPCERVYLPGDRVHLVDGGNNILEHIIAVTGEGDETLSIRFINTKTGKKAGIAYSCFSLERGSKGITVGQIENYLDGEYRVKQ